MAMRNKLNLYDLDFDELSASLDALGEPSYRASQIWDGLYHQLWSSPEEFSSLPRSLRQVLMEEYSQQETDANGHTGLSSLKPMRKITSSDGETLKTLFSLADGNRVEAVLMRYAKRRTLCISTQAGCAMDCVFCATGQMGFLRHLSSGEIIEQVLYYARQLKLQNEQVTNIVLMGMGEPFHNYDATLTSIKRLNDPQSFNLGARRFTISTVGLVPGIRRFSAEHSQVNLAISLHAAEDNLRSQLLPINRKYPLNTLFSACLDYVHATHRRISFEWALIEGVNDTSEQVHLLIQRLSQFIINGSAMCHVNLILLNPTQKYHGQASTQQKARAFKEQLEQAGIPCTIRLRRGIEIQAGCGQLAAQNNDTSITY